MEVITASPCFETPCRPYSDRVGQGEVVHRLAPAAALPSSRVLEVVVPVAQQLVVQQQPRRVQRLHAHAASAASISRELASSAAHVSASSSAPLAAAAADRLLASRGPGGGPLPP
eukprot:CAMPEP_0194577590 /NCGR_PEP_ID=MMETSP0292-20121207/12315_1 /TAXON_ID=39354 /ORGANISM="Heterosigma akashiwo, Strain CCMP2393" /LENGTH=114 /DNA_ID=CAMNT_0039430011 /DNA_START=317 /DNA_END=659 /DNA_ORIENTATION=+